MAYSFIISLKESHWQTSLYEVFSDMPGSACRTTAGFLTRAVSGGRWLRRSLHASDDSARHFLSLLLATLLGRKPAGSRFFRSALFLPNILDMLVIGLVWKLIYSPDGLLDTAFMKMGVEYFHAKGFLGDAHTALAAVAIAMVF